MFFPEFPAAAPAGIPPGSGGYPIAPYVINPQEPYALIAAGKNHLIMLISYTSSTNESWRREIKSRVRGLGA